MPEVSIIIPTYNSELFIEESLESVFKQTYKNYEIIVIDDGSSDSTRSILTKYKNRIVFLKKNNGGPASARNLGIIHSKGKYICFLDSDDLWSPSKLQDQVEYMNHNDCELSYTDSKVFITKDKKVINLGILKCDLKGTIFKDLFWNNFLINSTVMIKRICIDSVGLQNESKKIIGAEDYEYWLRVSLVFKIGHIPKTLTSYRLHNNNLLGNSYEKSFSLCEYIYRDIFASHPQISSIVGSNLDNCLDDLYLRYAYKNFIDGHIKKSLLKIIKSTNYSITKGVMAAYLVLCKDKNQLKWAGIIDRFPLWNKIVNNEWTN
ncbi:MAG: cell wall biosynthesis glycosyltransferase-like protein [uncultured bacterium]|nr:MAG: cell wall biosynthesis glycosyltransferase-like protein [uncultured bacterium]